MHKLVEIVAKYKLCLKILSKLINFDKLVKFRQILSH